MLLSVDTDINYKVCFTFVVSTTLSGLLLFIFLFAWIAKYQRIVSNLDSVIGSG